MFGSSCLVPTCSSLQWFEAVTRAAKILMVPKFFNSDTQLTECIYRMYFLFYYKYYYAQPMHPGCKKCDDAQWWKKNVTNCLSEIWHNWYPKKVKLLIGLQSGWASVGSIFADFSKIELNRLRLGAELTWFGSVFQVGSEHYNLTTSKQNSFFS